MRNKNEVRYKFKEFMNLVERQIGQKIKAVQSDNGKEYYNSTMNALYSWNSSPHTPEQNGIVERKNRTCVEMARCMIVQSGLPPSFWAEAISTTNYIRNQCITKGLNSGIPFEKWTGLIIAHMQTFGCNAFILDKSPNKRKFDIRGQKGILVGSNKSKTYRIWSSKDRKIHISHVKFFDKFNTKESFKDIVTLETKNGHLKIIKPTENSCETYIESNKSNQINRSNQYYRMTTDHRRD